MNFAGILDLLRRNTSGSQWVCPDTDLSEIFCAEDVELRFLFDVEGEGAGQEFVLRFHYGVTQVICVRLSPLHRFRALSTEEEKTAARRAVREALRL